MPAPSYTELGPKLGQPIVFVHGYPLDRRMWQAQAELLAHHGHRVLLPDLNGFGRTPAREGTGSIASYVEDLAELRTTLALDKIVLVGFSMGGYVALEYARRHPTTLRGLCLIDTRAEPDSQEGKKGRAEAMATARTKGAAAIAEAMLPKMLTDRTRTAKPDLAQSVSKIMREQSVDGIVRALEAMRDRPDQRPNLGHVACSTLIIVGAEDRITPIAASQEVQKQIPNAQLRIITGAAHLSPMEAPEPVNHFLDDWLRNLDASTMARTGIQRLGLKVERQAQKP